MGQGKVRPGRNCQNPCNQASLQFGTARRPAAQSGKAPGWLFAPDPLKYSTYSSLSAGEEGTPSGLLPQESNGQQGHPVLTSALTANTLAHSQSQGPLLYSRSGRNGMVSPAANGDMDSCIAHPGNTCAIVAWNPRSIIAHPVFSVSS